jgi:hypothetical protein
MQENTSGNSLYTGGVRYVTADEPTSCIRCGHDEQKALALGLQPPTMPKPGYIHCPLCSPSEVYCAADHNPTEREERQRISNEIRDVWHEETQRGIKGAGGGGSGRRREKKPGEKITIRYEQAWQGFANGNSAGECSATITVTSTRFERTDLEMNLRVPTALRDELINAATHRDVAASIVMRDAFSDVLPSIETVTRQKRGGDKGGRIRHLVSAGEKAMLKRESERHGCSLNELAAEVLSLYFYREL